MRAATEDQDLLSLYQEIILDHGKSPRNTGLLKRHSCKSEGRNPLCGDRVTVTAIVDGEKIADLKCDGKGCAISIASASMMTEAVKGLAKSETSKLFDAVHHLCTDEDSPDSVLESVSEDLAARLNKLVALSGVRRFPVRVKCATLPWHALRACLAGDTAVTTEN